MIFLNLHRISFYILREKFLSNLWRTPEVDLLNITFTSSKILVSWCPGVLVSLISIAHGSYCGCHEYLNNDHDFEFISSLMYIRRTYVAKVSFFTRTHEKLRRADLRRAPPPYIKQYCHRDRCTLQLFS